MSFQTVVVRLSFRIVSEKPQTEGLPHIPDSARLPRAV